MLYGVCTESEACKSHLGNARYIIYPTIFQLLSLCSTSSYWISASPLSDYQGISAYLDFHIVPVLCKDRVYQFRIKIVPADRFKHISRYIIGKLFFRSCRVELKECFQKCGSVIHGISVYTCVCFWCLWLIVGLFDAGARVGF